MLNDGKLKIGMVEAKKNLKSAIEKRIKNLDSLPTTDTEFRCIYAVEVPNEKFIERKLHAALQSLGTRIHKRREIFRIPEECAISLLEMFGENLMDPEIKPNPEPNPEPPYKQRPPIDFEKLGIKPGEILNFKENVSVKCTVYNNRKVVFKKSESMSLSALTCQIKERPNTSLAGPVYWRYKGEILADMRKRLGV